MCCRKPQPRSARLVTLWRKLHKLVAYAAGMHLQTRLKILVGTYQIFDSIPHVFLVRVPPEYTDWTAVFSFLKVTVLNP